MDFVHTFKVNCGVNLFQIVIDPKILVLFALFADSGTWVDFVTYFKGDTLNIYPIIVLYMSSIA